MTEVFRSLYPDITLDFSSPNHILGLSYAKENAKYVHPMELHPIRRKVQAIMKNHHRSEDSQCNSHSPCVRRRKKNSWTCAASDRRRSFNLFAADLGILLAVFALSVVIFYFAGTDRYLSDDRRNRIAHENSNC